MEKNCKTCGHQNEEICNTCPDISPDLCCGMYPVPDVGNKVSQRELYQCPYDKATKCDLEDPCLGCETWAKTRVSPPAEKVERFEKVYVRTEADLPKEDGDCFGMEKGSLNSFMSVLDFKTDKELRDGNSAYWMKFVEWWLRPVK